MPPLYDRRLVGTWQSDRWKTIRHFKFRPSTSRKHRRLFAGIFGKLKIRWGRRRYTWWCEGDEETTPPKTERYEIVAMDEHSVVIRIHDFLLGEQTLRQIHFEGDRYWMAVSGNLIEWFRKVDER